MYPAATAVSSICGTTDARCGLSKRAMRFEALYGVRSRIIGAPFAPFGTRTKVLSFTPSRIGIITSRLTKSNSPVFGWNAGGASPGAGSAASASAAPASRLQATSNTRRADARTFGMETLLQRRQENGALRPRSLMHPTADSLRGLIRLDQPLGPQGGEHRLAAADALLECLHVGEFRKVKFHPAGPARDRIEIRVRDAEPVAEQVLAALELPVDQGVAPAEVRETVLADRWQHIRLEERRVGLVDLGRDVVERLLQPHALEAAVRGREAARRLQVGEVLDDRGALGQ